MQYNSNVFNVPPRQVSKVKNIVRALAVVGFGSEHALTAQTKVANTSPVVNRVGCPPVPTCAPDDANGCGMSSWGSKGKLAIGASSNSVTS